MKSRRFQKSTAISLGLLIGCQLTTGCGSTSTVTTPNPPASLAAREANDTPVPAAPTSQNKKSETIAFVAPQPVITVAPPKADRSTRLIGLFGELEESSPNSGAPFDGGSNLTQVTFATEGACVDPNIDRTGTWLAFSTTMHRNTADIYIKSVTGKTQTQITSDPADDVMPCFSPDGKTIAFASNRSGNWDIYTVSTDGGKTVQITNDPDHELHPTWSPDGKTIAYCKFGAQSQRWEIWTVDATNPGARNFLEYGVFPQWCPDPARNKILFQRAKQRGSRDYSVWTIDIVNGQAKYPTEIASAANAALINPAWSPDGSRVVFVSVIDPEVMPESRPSQSDLWIVNIDGSDRTSLTNGKFANYQPVWASNGTVYFVSDRSGTDNIWAATATRQSDTNHTQPVSITSADSTTSESHP